MLICCITGIVSTFIRPEHSETSRVVTKNVTSLLPPTVYSKASLLFVFNNDGSEALDGLYY